MSCFNELANHEIERLAWFNEEMAEAQQALSKVLHHGYASHDPTKTNR
jgi:hypothetical protein